MYQKMTHTLEDLKKLAAMEFRDVNREELVDINDVKIKKDLSQRERMVDFVSQIKNPYCYLDRGMVVKISFAGENRLEDTLKKMRTDASEIKKKKAKEKLHFSTLKR